VLYSALARPTSARQPDEQFCTDLAKLSLVYMNGMATNNTVLCIHRDPAQLNLLQKNGYDVVAAANGSDGLRLFMSQAVDAVVLDYQLGLLNGGVVAAEIKKIKPRIPIVMLVDTSDVPKDALTSVDAVVIKSDGPQFLLESLHFVLKVVPAQRHKGKLRDAKASPVVELPLGGEARMPEASAAAGADFQRFFESEPGLHVVLSPERNYEIIAVTDSYLRATMTTREQLLGRSLFDVFPGNPADSGAPAVRNSLRASLNTVVRTGKPEVLTAYKYDIRRPAFAGGDFEERHWIPVNWPVFSADWSVRHIIHCVQDVTRLVQRKQYGNDEPRASETLQARAENSEAELVLRKEEIQSLTRELHAADAAQVALEASQLVQQTDQLREANSNLRDLTARLLQVRDEERRKIARELHDSIGQMLVAQSIYLSSIAMESGHLSSTAVKALTDSTALVEQMSKELRTISYLLHPPLLDEAGLGSAIRWFADGFAERSKIRVSLEVSPDLGRLSAEMEIAIFRIVQECLTNIYRHSGSPSAMIRLAFSAEGITLEVKDEGTGISAEKRRKVASGKLPGVGLRGMRERISQLGGLIEINSTAHGTAIIARFPIPGAAISIAS
jgi:signal transduction histidine kinase/DNA-binding LytR/AlgR family response regulator